MARVNIQLRIMVILYLDFLYSISLISPPPNFFNPYCRWQERFCRQRYVQYKYALLGWGEAFYKPDWLDSAMYSINMHC